ncbi:MAG: DEAD/DEAH box helicase family protein, partial [Prevotella sp.]|nr:DEAD/DEAH box helicase family protein [Prevotella sp.]
MTNNSNTMNDDAANSVQPYGINDVLREIRSMSIAEREKGGKFERTIQRWFLTDPRYEHLKKVWMWEDFPSRKDFGYGHDQGIDLVAKTDMNDYWAIQCKCYAEDTVIDKGDVNSFLANASKEFTDEETYQKRTFSNLIWVSTTRKKWGPNAELAIRGLRVPFIKINLYDLESSPVDWYKLFHGYKQGEEAKQAKKTILDHQQEAIDKAYKYYVEEDNKRGKLIMACGTGKTFTALKIMERITDKDSVVLFFVPSIALLSQTLNAWMADKTDEMRPICVCSDSNASRLLDNGDNYEDIDGDDVSVDNGNLPYPASTNAKTILTQINRAKLDKIRAVIMSTYQSIDVVIEALGKANLTASLCICDEAHRTTGVNLRGSEKTAFTKVHDNNLIHADKRLYMTATPRLYRESAKIKAKENDYILCSMDDETIYGKEFHRLGFNTAVSRGLLTDYKVMVLTVSENDIPDNIRSEIKEQTKECPDKKEELNFDDATKIIGCINGLSKRIKGDDGVTRDADPAFIHRAVAFCQTINPTKKNPTAASTQIAGLFPKICKQYKEALGDKAGEIVQIEARHIDGTMDANMRNERIQWLKEDHGE